MVVDRVATVVRDAVSRRGAAIPATDAGELGAIARRTKILRLVLALALLLVLTACVDSARRLEAREAAFLPRGASGMFVLDVSRSIGGYAYPRIYRTLGRMVDAGGPMGVIVFSDTAYELLPPGSSAAAVRPLMRYFDRRNARVSAVGAVEYPNNPWNQGFRAGTKVSSGLEMARRALVRDRVENGWVLLASDLDTSPADVNDLADTLVRFRDAGIRLRIVPLFPSADDREFFRRVLGKDAFVDWRELAEGGHRRTEHRLESSGPGPLVAAALVLILLLAANERWCGRLEWRRPARGAG